MCFSSNLFSPILRRALFISLQIRWYVSFHYVDQYWRWCAYFVRAKRATQSIEVVSSQYEKNEYGDIAGSTEKHASSSVSNKNYLTTRYLGLYTYSCKYHCHTIISVSEPAFNRNCKTWILLNIWHWRSGHILFWIHATIIHQHSHWATQNTFVSYCRPSQVGWQNYFLFVWSPYFYM